MQGNERKIAIDMQHVSKKFITPKKYPGVRGALKGLISREKIVTKAMKDISMVVYEGEIVGYIGSNGAGKSTSIKIMTGILTPTSGTCLVNGVDSSKEREKNSQNIGVVFGQRTQLWWDLPLVESFTILKEIYGVSQQDFDERIQFLSKVLDIDKFIDLPVRNLSLGQRMRADLAASLIHNPKILFLDEPTIGLDVVVKDKIREAIKQLNNKFNTTIILTTHDIDDIEELCNRIVIVDGGKIIFDGSQDELKEKFDQYCRITFAVPNTELIEKAYQNQIFDSNILLEKIEKEQGKIVLGFDKNKVEIENVIQTVMRITSIKDMSITEVSLEDVVKKIYSGK